MSPGWFYTRDGKSKSGPFSSAQLQALARSGQLQPTDMLWKEGMARWLPAREIKGLFSSISTTAHPPAVVPERVHGTGATQPAHAPPRLLTPRIATLPHDGPLPAQEG